MRIAVIVTTALIALILALTLATCSGADPAALTNEGRAALGKGDNRLAVGRFEEALAHMDAAHPQYLRAALGRCEALAKIDPKRCKDAFLELAKAQPSKVRESDFSLICNALIREGSYVEAIDVMHAGNAAFPTSTDMKAVQERVVAAGVQSNDPKALERLDGLGYTGSGK